jgi:hypothetical protein
MSRSTAPTDQLLTGTDRAEERYSDIEGSKMTTDERTRRLTRISKRGTWAAAGLVLAAATALVAATPASAAVQQSASRAYGDCTMQAYLDRDAGGIRAVAWVPCANWHPSVTVHSHLQYYDPSYTNTVEQNHWRNADIATWGPYSGYGMQGQPMLWTAKWTGCAYWRAETQISLTNSIPTAQQYVATPYVYLCA